MTTDIEQEFFKTFGIKHKCKRGKIVCAGQASNKCPTCQNNIYPEITDHKLLEMICVLSQWDADNYYQILANNMQDLKNEILNDCINFKQKLKNKYFDIQIQQLFKGEE